MENERQGQSGRERSGRAEATSVPKRQSAAEGCAQSGVDADAGDTNRDSTRGALPGSSRPCTKRSVLPDTPPHLEGGREWNGNSIS